MVSSKEQLKDSFAKQEIKKMGQYTHVGLLDDSRLIPFSSLMSAVIWEIKH
jgi:hypothetical protein